MATPSSRTLRVLFIGNSFTARNDLPDMVAAMAAASGRELDHRLVSAGGASLRRHFNGGTALREIERGGFDRVVLQEQSTLPIKNAGRMHENVRLFAEPIRAAGAKMVLYLTWARRAVPEAQEQITDAYTTIAGELKAAVIPAGVAWQALLRSHPEIVLHDRDGSHPTVAGTYVAACAAFGVLFEASPIGNSAKIDGVSDAVAEVLQRAADVAVRGSGGGRGGKRSTK